MKRTPSLVVSAALAAALGLGIGALATASTADGDGSAADAAESTPAASAPAELSDDPFSMQFMIDGEVFQLPCSVSDLERAGFTLRDKDAGGILEDGHATAVSLYYGDPDELVALACTVYNTSGAALPLEECMVDHVYFSSRLLEDHDIQIAGGILLGSSSQADVEAVYGPAEDPFVNGSYVAFDCEKEDDPFTCLEFVFSKGRLVNLGLNSSAEYRPWPQQDGAATGEEEDDSAATEPSANGGAA